MPWLQAAPLTLQIEDTCPALNHWVMANKSPMLAAQGKVTHPTSIPCSSSSQEEAEGAKGSLRPPGIPGEGQVIQGKEAKPGGGILVGTQDQFTEFLWPQLPHSQMYVSNLQAKPKGSQHSQVRRPQTLTLPQPE
jgi:hypothetical protein